MINENDDSDMFNIIVNNLIQYEKSIERIRKMEHKN